VTLTPYFVADYESEYVWANGDDYSSERIADDGSGAETDLSFSIWKIGREVGEVRHCKKRNGS
jgi:hypothetical protein